MDSPNSFSNVDEMLRNAELRTELEPYCDETLTRVNIQHWTLRRENDYLASMLRWEKAPALPIRLWFNPPLDLPPVNRLSDAALSDLLETVIQKLYEKRLVLDFTDHLSDRELYRLIVHSILPSCEKKIDHPSACIHWDCSSSGEEPDEPSEAWLTYYASDEERDAWADLHRAEPPRRLEPLYPRNLPGDRLR